MPTMGGAECSSLILKAAAKHGAPACKIVALTASFTPKLIGECLSVGIQRVY